MAFALGSNAQRVYYIFLVPNMLRSRIGQQHLVSSIQPKLQHFFQPRREEREHFGHLHIRPFQNIILGISFKKLSGKNMP
jgi:hypothetical protein